MSRRPDLVLVHGDLAPWPTDLRGLPLPRRPVRGLRVDVQWGEGLGLFDRWAVSTATKARFAARCSGREVSRPIQGWGGWLEELQAHEAAVAEGRLAGLSVHWPGCAISLCSCWRTTEPATRLTVVK